MQRPALAARSIMAAAAAAGVGTVGSGTGTHDGIAGVAREAGWEGDGGASYFTLTGVPRTPARAAAGGAASSHPGTSAASSETGGWGAGAVDGPWTAVYTASSGSEDGSEGVDGTPRHSVAGGDEGDDDGGWAGDNTEGAVFPVMDATAIVAMVGGPSAPLGATGALMLPPERPGSRDVIPQLAGVAARGRPLSRQELVAYVDPLVPGERAGRPPSTPHRYEVYRVAGIGDTSAEMVGSPRPPSRSVVSRAGVRHMMIPLPEPNAWQRLADETERLAHQLAALGESTETPGRDGHARMRALKERLELARKLLVGKRAARDAVTAADRTAAFVQHRVSGYVSQLVVAVAAHDVGTVIHALEAGAPPDTLLVSGDTVLMTLLRWNDPAAVVRALELGADPNVPNRLGVTPLALAVVLGSRSCVRALLHSGSTASGALCPLGPLPADLAAGAPPDTFGTPVMLAAALRRSALVKIMSVHASWRPNLHNAAGRTALMYACRHGSRDTVHMLLKVGAEASAVDMEGYSAFDWLCLAVAEEAVGSGGGGAGGREWVAGAASPGEDDDGGSDGGASPPDARTLAAAGAPSLRATVSARSPLDGPRGDLLSPVPAWKPVFRDMWDDLQSHHTLEMGVPYTMDESAPLPPPSSWPRAAFCDAVAVAAVPQDVLSALAAVRVGGGTPPHLGSPAATVTGRARLTAAHLAPLHAGILAAVPRSSGALPPLRATRGGSILKNAAAGARPTDGLSPPAPRPCAVSHCAFCTSRRATQRCTECLADMCDACCMAVHRGLPVNELHRVRPLDAPTPPGRGRTSSVMAVVGAVMSDMKLVAAAANRRRGAGAGAGSGVNVADAVAAAMEVVLTRGADARASQTLEAYFDAQAAGPAGASSTLSPAPKGAAGGGTPARLPPVERCAVGGGAAKPPLRVVETGSIGAGSEGSSSTAWLASTADAVTDESPHRRLQPRGSAPASVLAASRGSVGSGDDRPRGDSAGGADDADNAASPLRGIGSPTNRRGSAAEMAVCAAIAASRATASLAQFHEGNALGAAGEKAAVSSTASAAAAAANMQRRMATFRMSLRDTAPSAAASGSPPPSRDGTSPLHSRAASSHAIAFTASRRDSGVGDALGGGGGGGSDSRVSGGRRSITMRRSSLRRGSDEMLPDATQFLLPAEALPPPVAARAAESVWRALGALAGIKLGAALLAAGNLHDAVSALQRAVDSELTHPRRRMEVVVYGLLQLAGAQSAAKMAEMASRSLARAAAAIHDMPEPLRPPAACSVAVAEARLAAAHLPDPALAAATVRGRLLAFLAAPPGCTWAALLAHHDDASAALDAVGPAVERRKMAADDLDAMSVAAPSIKAAAAGAGSIVSNAAAMAAAVRRASLHAPSLGAVAVAAAAAAAALPGGGGGRRASTSSAAGGGGAPPLLLAPVEEAPPAESLLPRGRRASALSSGVARAALTIQRWYAGHRARRWLAATVCRRWVRRVDPDSGAPFFVDLHTGDTRWELPPFLHAERLTVAAVCASCATPAGGGTLADTYCLQCDRGACAACFTTHCAPAAHVGCPLPLPVLACSVCQSDIACMRCATCAAGFCAACAATAHAPDHAAATLWLPPLQAAYDAMMADAAGAGADDAAGGAAGAESGAAAELGSAADVDGGGGGAS